VEPRHDRPPQRGHDLDGDGVHGHVEAPVGAPEDQQRQAQGDRGMGLRRKQQRAAKQHAGGHSQPGRAEPSAQRAGQHHGGHRARGQAEQGEPQGGGRGAVLLLDGRDPYRPAGEDEPVDREHRAERGPGGLQPAGFAVRPEFEMLDFVYQRHKIRLCS
jgi:hypothetical protein